MTLLLATSQGNPGETRLSMGVNLACPSEDEDGAEGGGSQQHESEKVEKEEESVSRFQHLTPRLGLLLRGCRKHIDNGAITTTKRATTML